MVADSYTPTRRARPAVFLDRDGTINVEKNYLYRYEEWEWIAGAQDAIARLNKLGFLVVVVTNQAGIARGLYKERDVERLHQLIAVELKESGASIDAFYFCPHHPDFTDACNCRKPSSGMILEAARNLHIDLSRSWMVGDKISDIEAGHAAGISTILVRTGYGENESQDTAVSVADFIVDSIMEAVETIATSVY